MGIGEIRGVIVPLAFLGFIVLLLLAVPAGLFPSTYEGREVRVPDKPFEAVDVTVFADWVNFTITKTLETFSFGGWNMRFGYHSMAIDYFFFAYTFDYFLAFEYNIDTFHWYSQGIKRSGEIDLVLARYRAVSLSWINKAYADNGTEGLKWNLQNDRTSMTLIFGFDTSLYETPRAAFLDGALSVLLGMNMDATNTAYNIWNLLGNLMFFQSPDIHPVINAFIALPIWAAFAIILYLLIVKLIPFAGG